MSGKLVLTVDLDSREPDLGYDMGLSSVLNDPGIEVRFYKKERDGNPIPPEVLKDVDTFISVERPVTEASLAQAAKLKWIGRFGAGFDNVDLKACTARGILVSNSPQGVWMSVPEIVVGYMLTLANKFKIFDRHIREKGFEGKNAIMIRCLHGKTAGIVGFGGIGSALAGILRAFNVNVLVHDPFADEKRVAAAGARKTDLETLLGTSDFVSINVPLTASTRGMIGAKEIGMMKPSAFLINTSRGFVCDDEALAAALRDKRIAGAAVDVFAGEPKVENNPLVRLECDSLILTPHVAGANNIDAMTMVGEKLAECVVRIKNGQFPINVVNPDASRTPLPGECRTPSFVSR